MKNYVRLALASGLLLLFPVMSQAAIIITANDTGVGVAVGANDANYDYADSVVGGPAAAIRVAPHPAWADDSLLNGKWIAPNSAATPTGAASGNYITNVSIAVTAGELLSNYAIKLTGGWAIDDKITDVLVNGSPTGAARTTGTPYASVKPFEVSSTAWVVGNNKVEFVVADTGGVVTGLLLDGLSGSSALVPEPGTLAIWGLLSSLIGLGFLRRKRQA